MTLGNILPVSFDAWRNRRASQLDLTLVGPDQGNRFKYDHKNEHAERYVFLGSYHTDFE